MSAAKESTAAQLATFATAVIITIPAALWSAFVAIVLWGWFVTPWIGIAAPDVMRMCGLILLARMPFAKIDSGTGEPTIVKVWSAIIFSVVYPALVLLIGWVFHLIS